MKNINTDTIASYLDSLAHKGYSKIVIERKLNLVQNYIKWAYHKDQLSFSNYQQSIDAIAKYIADNLGEGSHRATSVHDSDSLTSYTPPQAESHNKKSMNMFSSLINRMRFKENLSSNQFSSIPPQYFIASAIVLLVISILGAGIYARFFQKTQSSLAYAPTPISAGRVLSFQGRLLDSLGNPITTATNMRFRLYDDPSAGSTLYDSGTCSITPDQDGIHNVLIGDDCGSEIGSNVFSENVQIWLGVTVGSDSEMTPRQQIANVPYAINAETLQGLPPGTSASNISYIDRGGDLLIGASSPQVGSIYASQTFLVSSANAITLQSAGSGDVTLTATESGTIKFATGGSQHGLITNTGLFGFGTTGPDAKLDVLYTGGEQLRLTYTDGSAYTGFTTSSGGDLTIDPSGDDLTIGGDVILTDTFTLQAGGKSGTAYNTFANSAEAPEEAAISSDNDLYVGGDVEIDGTLYANISGTITPGFTQGSVVFIDGSGNLAQDNTQFFFDDTNNKLGLGTASPTGKLTVTGATVGKALAIFNETGDQNIITASASGTTVANLDRSGNLAIEGALSDLGGTTLDVSDNLDVSGTLTSGTANAFTVDATGNISTSGTTGLTFSSTGGINLAGGVLIDSSDGVDVNDNLEVSGDTTLTGDLAVNGGDITSTQTTFNFDIGNTGTLNFRDGSNSLVAIKDQGVYPYLNLAGKTDTGDPASCAEGDIYYNDTDDTIKICHESNTWEALDGAAVSGPWTDSGTTSYLTDTTDEVVIGGSTPLSSSKLSIDGDADQIQLTVQGNATQTTNLAVFENSAGTDLFTIDGSGNVIVAGTTGITFSSTGGINLAGGTLSDTSDGVDIADNLEVSGNTTLAGTLAVNGDSITDDSNLTVDATGYVRIGDTASPGSASGDDDLFVEGDLEVDGVLYLDGTVDTTFTAGSIVFAGASGVLAQDNAQFFFNDTDNKLGLGTASPDGKLHVTGAAVGKALAIFNETGDQDILTGSASGATRFRVTNDGTIHGGYFLDISNTAYGIDPAGTSNFGGYSQKITGGALLAYDSGNVGIGNQTPVGKLDVNGAVVGKALVILNETGDQNILVASASGVTQATLSRTGDLTLVGDLAVNGDDITSNDTLTLDAVTDIVLDADGADVFFKDSGTTFATFTNSTTDLTLDIAGGQLILADGDVFNIGGVTALGYNAISDSGTAGHGLASDDDLYIEGDLEVDGSLWADGTLTAGDLVCTDCLDFTDFEDTLDVDSTTDINLGANNLTIDLDSTGIFDIRDGATTFVSFDDDSTIDVTFPVAGTLGIDAAAADNTTTAGVINLDVDTATSGNIGSSIDYQVIDSAGNVTVYAEKIDVTVDTDAGQSHTVNGSYIGITANDASSTTYGLHIVGEDAGAQVATAGILIENLQATDIDLTTGLLIRATTDGSLPTAVDVSDAEITTALATGANDITGTSWGVVGSTGVGTFGGGTFNGNIDMTNDLIVNIGNSSTAFTTGGGLTLVETLAVYDDVDIRLDTGEDLSIASYTSAPTVDIVTISNSGLGTTTSAVDGLAINFIVASDGGADTNAGAQITFTDSGDSSDTIYGLRLVGGTVSAGTQHGINIAGITGGAGTEVGITIGAGWDTGIDLSANTLVNIGNSSTDFTSSGGLTLADNLAVNGGTITSSSSLTLDVVTDITLDADGADIFLKDAGVNFATFTNSTTDLTLDIDGGQLILADADVFNIGGVTGLAYNAISDSGTTGHGLASDDDLYIEGDLEVDGSLWADGTLTAGDLACTDCLDFAEFEDTLDLDASLTVNQSTNTWTQNFTGDTTTGLTYNANSITTGTAVAINSTATAFTSGTLLSLDWSPGSLNTNADDLFKINTTNNGNMSGYYINLLKNSTTVFNIDQSGNIITTGDLAVDGDDITANSALTINSASYVRIGDSGTPGTANGDDDLYVEGDLEVDANALFDGNITFGNSAADTVVSTSKDWTFSSDTTVVLSGGVDGINFDANTLSIDATNNRVGFGTAAPDGTIHVTGANIGKALTIFNETGDQNIFVASDSGTGMFSIGQQGDMSRLGSSAINGLPDQGSIAPNASFEVDNDANGYPDGWTESNASTTTYTTTGGGHGEKYISINNDSTYYIYSTCVPISASQTYVGSGRVRNNVTNEAAVRFQIEEYATRSNCESRSSSTGTASHTSQTVTANWAGAGATFVGATQTTSRWGRMRVANMSTLYVLDVDGVRFVPSTSTSGLDLAETYPSSIADNINIGEIVAMGTSEKQNGADVNNIKRATKPYDSLAFGVIATKPGLLLDDDKQYEKVSVALKGRVPVLVTTENGPIKVGDPITPSSKPGIGMKATHSGKIIGYAMTEWTNPDPNQIDQVTVFVNPETYVDLSILTNMQNQLKELPGSIINGTQKLIAQAIEVTNATIDTLIVDRIVGNQIDAKKVTTETLEAQNIVAKDISSDSLSAETLSAENATVSGTLVADEIDSKNIREFRDNLTDAINRTKNNEDAHLMTGSQLAELNSQVEEIQNYISEFDSETEPLTTQFQEITDDIGMDSGMSDGSGESIVSFTDVYVTGQANMYSAVITDSFATGNIMLKNDSIISLQNELKLSALVNINLFDGAVIIAKDGTITTKGEVIAQKGVRTNTIQPIDGDINLHLPDDQKKVSITNNNDDEVASIDQRGRGTFSDISLNKFNGTSASSSAIIASDVNFQEHGINAPGLKTNAESSGDAILPAGSDRLVIYNDSLTPESLVYITATSSTDNLPLYVSQKNICPNQAGQSEKASQNNQKSCTQYFTVSLDGSLTTDVTFNWWIVH